tara:strand:+ start:20472 stop:20819 length:348 start_codon:yes stop_codon:yes gene_type:complete
MPFYLYQHPETQEVQEVLQRMTDEHVYVDDCGVKWNRIFTSPAAVVDGKMDAFSPRDFVEKTRDKGMTMGQLWDESAAASEKRKKEMGHDPLKKDFFKKYSEKRNGMKHQDDPKR